MSHFVENCKKNRYCMLKPRIIRKLGKVVLSGYTQTQLGDSNYREAGWLWRYQLTKSNIHSLGVGGSCLHGRGSWRWVPSLTIVSIEVNISIYCYSADIRIYLLLDNEIDRKIDVTAMQFLLVQNRHQTHDWTLIGSGDNGPRY